MLLPESKSQGHGVSINFHGHVAMMNLDLRDNGGGPVDLGDRLYVRGRSTTSALAALADR
jgi:hypothetical protein